MEAGCLAILEKPHGLAIYFPIVAKAIVDTILNIANAKLITRRGKQPPVLSHPSNSYQKVEAIAIVALL